MRLPVIFLGKVLLILFCSLKASSQPRCSVLHYSTEDGLPDNRVMCITKDHEGFMWFGTWAGITRFDGHNFVTFRSQSGERSNFETNRIDGIVEDAKGFLWLRTYNNQLYRFDKKTEQFLFIPDIIKEDKTAKISFRYIIATKEGPVWLLTINHGVFCMRSNGTAAPIYEHYAFGVKGATPLPDNDITLFHADSTGQVWIGTPKGLVLLAKGVSGKYESKPLPPLPVNETLKHVQEDGSQLWFTGENGHLLQYSKTTHQFNTYKLAATALNGLQLASNDNYIYCTSAGGELIQFNKNSKTFLTYKVPGGQSLKSVTADKLGNIWIEPTQNGIIRFDPATRSFNNYTLQSDPWFFNSFKGYETFIDNKDRFWALMKGSGLGYYNTSTKNIDYFYNSPANPMRLFPNSVRLVYYDQQGVLWLATMEEGLHRVIFYENNFEQKLVTSTPGRLMNEVRGICTDHLNRLWLTSKAGFTYVLKDGVKVNINLENIQAGNLGMVYCIMEDQQNNIWLGTKDKGLYKATPVNAACTNYRLQQFLPGTGEGAISSEKIYSLLQDQQGNIWVGTFENGLNLVQQQGDKTYFLHRKNGLSNYPAAEFDRIRHLTLDGAGRMWIGTTEGLLVMKPNTERPGTFLFKPFKKSVKDKTSLSDNDIQFIYKSAANIMWLGTTSGGLNKAIGIDPFNGLQFQNYTTKDGLLSDCIVSCTEDNQGNLWLATANNISRYDGTHFRSYDAYDGIATGNFSESACTRLPNGDLVFGATNGYLQFSPAQVKEYKINGNLVFTNLQVNSMDVNTNDSTGILKQSINDVQEITLAYDQNILSIDYSLLDYRYQDDDQFAYRLKGFDDTWRNNKKLRRATYTYLPPGKYLFEVKTLNTDRYNNAPVKQLSIRILPPPWRTTWAYLLYITVAIIIGIIVYRTLRTMLNLRQRISVERKLTDLKLRFYNNISHELRTPLTLIQGPIEAVVQSPRLTIEDRDNLYIARKNVTRMSRFINQLLDLGKAQSGKASLRISNADIILLTRQVTDYFSEAFREKQIQLHIHAEIQELHAWVDDEKLETVLYNLLGNALKFSPTASTITISIKNSTNPGWFIIEVSDEGPGVDQAELENIFQLYYESHQPQQTHLKGSGIGLALSKEFIELHHGNLYARNNAGKGLTVVIELQKNKDHFAPESLIVVTTPSFVKEENTPILPATITQQEQSDAQLVLLVEDNTELSSFLANQLRTQYRVEIAADGLQGLHKAQQQMPDLIVSDIMMPNMDGITMLDQLKRDPATSHIPVVLLSARYDLQSQIEGLQYGADYYITKPFHTDFLKASINNLLSQRKKAFRTMQDKEKPKATIVQPAEIVITSQDEQFLNAVINFVEEGMHEPEFEIETMATSANMSRSAFYKKFKSLTNMAPLEFVNEMRLKRAKQLFDAGEQNISSVAYSTGFNSAKYFSTCFKKYYECSPSDYIKNRATIIGEQSTGKK